MSAPMPLTTRSAPASIGRYRPCRAGRGFSLIELMIAIVIGSIITLALGMMMTENMNARANLQKKGERLENGRFAIDMLRDDLVLAGYYGGYWPVFKDLIYTPASGAVASGGAIASGTWGWVYTESEVATPVLPTDFKVAWANPDICSTSDLGWLVADPPAVPLPLMGFAAGSASATAATCLANRKPESDVVVIRRASTTPTVAAGAPADIYLQVSDCYGAQESGQAYDAVPFVLSSSASAFTLKRGDCAGVAALRKYIAHAYYVACDPNCANPDNVPTLRRAELVFTGGVLAVQTVPLVPGIDHFQVQFGVDTNSDGAMDGGFLDPTAVTDWRSVVTARLLVVARDLVRTPGFNDGRSFGWPGEASATIAAASGDAAEFRRQSFTTVVNLVNLGSRKE